MTMRPAARNVIVETELGKVRGLDIDGVKTFKGISYGASTTGKHRFMPPRDPPPWTGIRDALNEGSSAPQTEPGRPAAAGLPPESEDCLVLNVWTPAIDPAGRQPKRPVMLWLHGGGFDVGCAVSPVTDGTNLARRGDVVVVSINHRLNALGFTHLDALGGQDFALSGNLGMLDIVHALTWVRRNIAVFGGDPDAVTVFGQSGGGRKVGTLLAMPAARGLFHRAVMQSGPTLEVIEREAATRIARRFLDHLGVSPSRVHQLQELPLDRILGAYFATVRSREFARTPTFFPTVDGDALPTHPFSPVASSMSPEVPVLVGHTRNEMTITATKETLRLSHAGLRERITVLLGERTDGIIDFYRRASPQASPSELYFEIATDFYYVAPIAEIAGRRAALGGGPVFLYCFDWVTPVGGGRLGSPHAIDVPFVFDNVAASRLTSASPGAPALAPTVRDAWVAFARRGEPNTPALPPWPAFSASSRSTMCFDDESRVLDDPFAERRAAMCRALDLG